MPCFGVLKEALQVGCCCLVAGREGRLLFSIMEHMKENNEGCLSGSGSTKDEEMQ